MKVVITSAAMLTSVGLNTKECFDSLCAGKHGLGDMEDLDPSRFSIKQSYVIPKSRLDLGEKRATELLRRVMADLVNDYGSMRDKRVAVVIGTGLRETRTIERWAERKQEIRLDQLHFGAVAKLLDCREVVGPFVISNACSSSLFALALGEDLLAAGQADLVIAAGCDVLAETMHGYLNRANAVPPRKLQPFDRNRVGTLLGEGAAAIAIELEDSAKASGRKPLAVLGGVAINCDAFHETAPHAPGVERCMREAHRRAGVTPDNIQLIMAHGTGTPLNDANEINVLNAVFGATLRHVYMTGIKSMTGHTSGASGLVSLIAGMESMRTGRIPPTLFLENPIPEAEDLLIPRERVVAPEEIRTVQVNAFGFGGINAVAIIKRY